MNDNISHKANQVFVVALLGFLLWLLPLQFINTALAQQCFSDVKAAYQYLLAQENASQKVLQAGGNQIVNINTATEAELTTLKGIGPAKAQEIILYREGFGRFDSVDELTEVKGIGAKTVENNRDRLSVD